MEIDLEIQARLELEKVGLDAARALEIKTEINLKHLEAKRRMVASWQQAKDESQYMYKQKKYKKYQKLFHQYAYPLNSFKFRPDETQGFLSQK
jgi:hypothetical protein